MNRSIDKPGALMRQRQQYAQRVDAWRRSHALGERVEPMTEHSANSLLWCEDMLALYDAIAVVELLRALVRVHDVISVGDGMTATVHPSCDGWIVRRSDGAELHATSKTREWRRGIATLYPSRLAALDAAHPPESD